MIYLAVTSRTWPAWSAPDEDGNWQKIFQHNRATWKIFGNIPTCTLHIRSHPYHCTSPQMAIWGMVRLVRIEIWNPKNIEVPAVRRARGQIWNEKKKAKKHLKVLPVTRCVVALAEFPGDGLRRVTSAPAALTRTTTRADRSTWWRVGRSGEKDTKRCKQQRWHLQVDSGLSGFVWLPEHSHERPK